MREFDKRGLIGNLEAEMYKERYRKRKFHCHNRLKCKEA
jgi:hypothetical protein